MREPKQEASGWAAPNKGLKLRFEGRGRSLDRGANRAATLIGTSISPEAMPISVAAEALRIACPIS